MKLIARNAERIKKIIPQYEKYLREQSTQAASFAQVLKDKKICAPKIKSMTKVIFESSLFGCQKNGGFPSLTGRDYNKIKLDECNLLLTWLLIKNPEFTKVKLMEYVNQNFVKFQKDINKNFEFMCDEILSQSNARKQFNTSQENFHVFPDPKLDYLSDEHQQKNNDNVNFTNDENGKLGNDNDSDNYNDNDINNFMLSNDDYDNDINNFMLSYDDYENLFPY